MRIEGTHLGHCTNVHPAESGAEVLRMLATDVAEVRARVGGPYGVGLRVSAAAARELDVAELRDVLAANELYVFTINGFPYGDFGVGRPVKTRVYQPDWRTAERAAFTERLARLAAAITPHDVTATVSTLPVGFAEGLDERADAHAAAQLLSLVPALERIEQDTGRAVIIALEPEPFCRLETTAQLIDYFDRYLPAPARRFFGICLDVCHLAVMFEEPRAALSALRRAGVPIAKVQLSVGLRARLRRGDAPPADLARLADPIFLHQVIERHADGRVRRFLDLDDALRERDGATDVEWRIHHHVPIHRERLGALESTRRELLATIEALCDAPLPPLEIETYAFGALPEEHRTAHLADEIAREISFVREQLARDEAAPLASFL